MSQGQGIDRELSLGEVISKTFELYRRDFMKYFIIFAVVEVIIGAVTTLASRAFVLPTLSPGATPQQLLNWFPSFISALLPLVATIFVVTVVFYPIAQGARSSWRLSGFCRRRQTSGNRSGSPPRGCSGFGR